MAEGFLLPNFVFVEKFQWWTEGITKDLDPTELGAVAQTCTSLWASQRFLQVSGLHVEKSWLLSVVISQWSERRQRLLQSQREKLGVHTIVFPGYSLSVWECACPVRVCVGLHLTGSPITKHCALALVFLSMVHWTKGHGKWRPKEERWWLDRTEVTVCVLLFLSAFTEVSRIKWAASVWGVTSSRCVWGVQQVKGALSDNEQSGGLFTANKPPD